MIRPTFILALTLLSGCGYQLGVVPRDDVRRVAITVFDNKTLRRGFERDLTRAVQREVKETTPYLIAKEADADLIMRGEISSIQETVLIEGRNDEVLEGRIEITVRVSLFDRTGRKLPIARFTRAGQQSDVAVIQDQAEFVLTRGEDRNSATREAIKELAERVVQILHGPPL